VQVVVKAVQSQPFVHAEEWGKHPDTHSTFLSKRRWLIETRKYHTCIDVLTADLSFGNKSGSLLAYFKLLLRDAEK
jgi:hypothetical protein